MDSMKDESGTNASSNPPQTIKPYYQSTTTPTNSNSCCGSFT
jgi:hypothetical protein